MVFFPQLYFKKSILGLLKLFHTGQKISLYMLVNYYRRYDFFESQMFSNSIRSISSGKWCQTCILFKSL